MYFASANSDTGTRVRSTVDDLNLDVSRVNLMLLSHQLPLLIESVYLELELDGNFTLVTTSFHRTISLHLPGVLKILPTAGSSDADTPAVDRFSR